MSQMEMSSASMSDFLGLKPITVIGLDGQFSCSHDLSCHWPWRAISLVSSPLLSSALTGNFLASSPFLSSALTGNSLNLKPIAVISLNRQFPWPQAQSCPQPRWVITFASSPLLSSAATGNFLGLKPGAVLGLDGQFPRPQARSCHQPWRGISLASSP